MSNYILGIDIGGTTAKLGLFSEEHFPEIIVKRSVKTRPDDGGKYILPDIAEGIKQLFEDEGIDKSQIDGIGVGVPGPVIIGDRPGQTLVNKCVNLGWGVKDVASELSELTGIEKVVVENDANAAALGEIICGSVRDMAEKIGTYRKVTEVLVTIGTGIGGGIILNDRLLVGKDFSAGEYSYLCTNDRIIDSFDGFWCRNGHRVIGEKLSAATGEPEETLDGVELFRRIRDNDETAKQVLREIAADYAVQIYNLSVLLNLEKIAVGGGISADPLLIDYLKKALWDMYDRLPFGPEKEALPMADVVACEFRNDANLIGALYHHLYGTWEN